MSDSPQPDQPAQPDQPEQPADAAPPVDPKTGEDLSWKQIPMSFVLLDRPAPTRTEVSDLLTEIFDGSFEVRPGTDEDPATAVLVEDATVLVSPIDSPIPDGEASRYTADLAMWGGKEAVVDTHRSQVVVAAFRWGPLDDDDNPTAPEYMDPREETLRCELAVANVAAALTALPGAVAVSVGGAAATLPAGPYRELVSGNPIPAPALIGVRVGMQSESTSAGYTTGMGRFGRMDLERLDVPAPPGAVYGQMCDLVAYSLASSTIFVPGQSIDVGGPEPLVAEALTSPFTGQEALRLSPSGSGEDSPAD